MPNRPQYISPSSEPTQTIVSSLRIAEILGHFSASRLGAKTGCHQTAQAAVEGGFIAVAIRHHR